MLGAVPILLWSLAIAGEPPMVLIDDATACVEAANLEAALADPAAGSPPPGTTVRVTVQGEGGAPVAVVVEVALADPDLPVLERTLPVDRADCEALPSVLALIVERFCADLPATAWPAAPSPASPAGPKGPPPTPAVADVATPVPLRAVEPRRRRAHPVWLLTAAEVQAGSAFAGTQGLHRARLAAETAAGLHLGPLRAGAFLELGGELWEPLGLGAGQVWVGGLGAAGGALVGTDRVALRLLARGGGLGVAGTGYTTPLLSAVPAAELGGGLDLFLPPARVRVELTVPLLRPRFRVRNLAEVGESPVLWVTLAFGGALAWDLGL